MSFKKFAAAEIAVKEDKLAVPSKATAMTGPQDKTADKTPTAETPAPKS